MCVTVGFVLIALAHSVRYFHRSCHHVKTSRVALAWFRNELFNKREIKNETKVKIGRFDLTFV